MSDTKNKSIAINIYNGQRKRDNPFFKWVVPLADSGLEPPNNFFSENNVTSFAIPHSVANIKLPDNFIEDLEKIENFYNLCSCS